MTYEGLLNAMHVDPNDEDSPLLQWFVQNDPEPVRKAKIAAAGKNTYAHLSPLLPGGNTLQFANPKDGINFSHNIITTLYTPPVGRDKLVPNETQIAQLYGALITAARKVTQSGYGTTFHSFSVVPSQCQPWSYDEQSRGLIARVVHNYVFTIRP
jgi:hypothetical protein